MDAIAAGRQQDRTEAEALGTRFLIFPQAPFIPGYDRPEIVWISTPAGAVAAGPADHRMYVVDPLLPKAPYQWPYRPPWTGDAFAPPEPGPEGHFDHVPVNSREFLAAHSFACVRRVLDVTESYLRREVPWFFQPTHERLEIVPHLPWANAQSGFGFLELGEDDSRDEPFPYALNFDVIAHETSHLVLFGIVGTPDRSGPSQDYLAYHEFAADFLALICLLQFDSVLDKVLRRTKGNLLITNELDRTAELIDERPIRTASHSLRRSDVGQDVHDLSRPFTGAMFDSLIEIFQLLLVERNLAELDPRSFRTVRGDLTQDEIERGLEAGHSMYGRHHFAIKSALEEARDIVGEALLRSWETLDPDALSFRRAAFAMLDAVERGRGMRFTDRVEDNLAWRELI